MRITRTGDFPAFPGSPDNFSGEVRFTNVYMTDAPGRIVGGTVEFAPGSRTHWHTHPFGQILIVTEGTGWTQCEGEDIVEIQAGDVITCPAEVRHWHGATAATAMTHIAIAEGINGAYATWLEPVTDAQYLANTM